MTCHQVVIISEDAELQMSLAALLAQAGFDTRTADSLEAWLTARKSTPVRCLVIDLAPGALLGPEQLAHFSAACAEVRVLVLTASGDVPTAVDAIRRGASDVLQRSTAQGNMLDRITRLDSLAV